LQLCTIFSLRTSCGHSCRLEWRRHEKLEYAFPAGPAIDQLGILSYRRHSLHHIDVVVLKAMVLQDFVQTGANRVAQEMRHAMRKNLNRFSS
jgi:hypothetical protein